MKNDIHGGGLRIIASQGDVRKSARSITNHMDLLFYDLNGEIENANIELTSRLNLDTGNREYTAHPSEAANRIFRAWVTRDETSRMHEFPSYKSTKSQPIIYKRIADESSVDLPRDPTILNLGRAMKELSVSLDVSNFPAIFTYVGQFIAHDLTYVRFGDELAAVQNFNSHGLSLKSIFDEPEGEFLLNNDYLCSEGKFTLGRTHGKDATCDDLPRNFDLKYPAVPCIADTRNDNNLGVAQLTIAIIKFCNHVCKACKDLSTAEQKTIAVRHFQSIVLHDYLPRIIPKIIYDEVYVPDGASERVLVSSGDDNAVFYVPPEFSVACFRFGHSLPRFDYDWNADQGSVEFPEFLEHCSLGNFLSRPPVLKSDWVADWQKFGRNEMSAAINPRLHPKMMALERGWFDDPNISEDVFQNLAEVTLKRGQSFKLMTGQHLHALTQQRHPRREPYFGVLGKQEIFDDSGVWSSTSLTCEDVQELSERTPLWYYVLREAELKSCGGACLGPLGGRVVMETIHAGICAVPDNIIDTPFEVDSRVCGAVAGRKIFRLSDMLRVVRGSQT